MTKAQHILMLAATMADERGLPAKIAAVVGTTDSYVRTVMRQRKGHSKSDADIRYKESPLGKATARRCAKEWYGRKKADPEFVAKRRRSHKAWRDRQPYSKLAEERRASYERNREHRLAYQRQYNKVRRAQQLSTNASAKEEGVHA